MFGHRYSVTECPDCGFYLTEPGGVLIVASFENGATIEVPSRLEPDGTLVDQDDLIEHGKHAGTQCGSCWEPLDDYEV